MYTYTPVHTDTYICITYTHMYTYVQTHSYRERDGDRDRERARESLDSMVYAPWYVCTGQMTTVWVLSFYHVLQAL